MGNVTKLLLPSCLPSSWRFVLKYVCFWLSFDVHDLYFPQNFHLFYFFSYKVFIDTQLHSSTSSSKNYYQRRLFWLSMDSQRPKSSLIIKFLHPVEDQLCFIRQMSVRVDSIPPHGLPWVPEPMQNRVKTPPFLTAKSTIYANISFYKLFDVTWLVNR